MAEGAYVKLTKDQDTLQNITPGELNQPIDVARVNARKCPECGQALPPTYQPPADEDWSTGICGCAEDPESCWKGLFCPCALFGENVERLDNEFTHANACACHLICIEGGMTLAALTAAFHGMIAPDTAFLITEGLLFAWWMCGIYTGMARQSLQRKYHLKDSPCDPCMVHCCFHWCALCQEHREMNNHLENAAAPTAIVVPPTVQQMNTSQEQGESSSSEKTEEKINLQLQPV